MDNQEHSDLEDGAHSEDNTQSSNKVEVGAYAEEAPRFTLPGKFGRLLHAVVHLPIYSWSWFLMPMTTVGLSTLLHAQISLHNFHGLYTLGLIVYFIGFVEFFFLLLARLVRYAVIPKSFRHSFQTSEQWLFFASFWISCYGIVTGAIDFSNSTPGSGLSDAFHILFWCYMACAILVCIGIYTALFHRADLKDREMTPAWLLPVLPVILAGVMAGSLVDILSTAKVYSIVLGGLICSGMGFLFSLPMAAIYLHRLFVIGLPQPNVRLGMMIAVGPPSYAPLGFLKMASKLPNNYGYFAAHPQAIETIQTMAFVLSIAIFGLAIVFFLMASGPILRRASYISFHLTWYGLIFPNVGLVSTMGVLGELIPSDGVIWVATVATVVLAGLWILVTLSHAVAILRKSPDLW